MDELFRLFERRLSQKHGVDEAEDSDIGSDSQSEREDGRYGKSRTLQSTGAPRIASCERM